MTLPPHHPRPLVVRGRWCVSSAVVVAVWHALLAACGDAANDGGGREK